MTVTTTINRNDHIGDGSTTVFAFTFAIQQSTDMSVYLDGVLSASGYTVSINSNGVGGNVTFSTAPVDDTEVTLIREVDYTQETSLPHDANIPEETVEDAFDKAVMLVQQVKEITSRCLILPVQVTGFDTTFPDPRESPGYISVINDDGDGFALKSANEIFNDMEGGGYGDVIGPISSTANGLPLFNGATGKILKDAGYAMPTSIGAANEVLKVNSAGTAIEFGVGSAASSGFQGRLTLESGVLISTSDQLAKTTLYLKGGVIPNLVSSVTTYKLISGGQISVSLASINTTQPYDVFARVNSGTAFDTLELVAWTNATTRATALTYVADGDYYVHATNTTWTYVGTIQGSASGQCEDSTKFRGVWSYGKRALRPVLCFDTTNSWTYALTAYREINGGSTLGTSRIGFVLGLAEDLVRFEARGMVAMTGGVNDGFVGVGIDSSTVNSAQIMTSIGGGAGGYTNPITAMYKGFPSIGSHTARFLEAAAAASSKTFYGDNNVTQLQSGMFGEIWC